MTKRRKLKDRSRMIDNENWVRKEAYRHNANVIVLKRDNKESVITTIWRKFNAWRNRW